MNPLHYPSLELCKKLKEIGFPHTEKCFWHSRGPDTWEIAGTWYFPDRKAHAAVIIMPCPSVMEMLDVMPPYIGMTEEDPWHKAFYYTKKGNVKMYYPFDNREVIIDTLPNALASMILWLHKEGHLTFDK